MSGTILLFGCNRISNEIAQSLHQKGYAFTIIDTASSHTSFNVHLADYSEDSVLIELGIGTCVTHLFALFEEDAENVFLTLSAKALDPSVKVIAITHTKDAIHKLEMAGADTILDPYHITGKKLYKLITQPEVMKIIDTTLFGEHNILLDQLTITQTSLLNARMLDEVLKNAPSDILCLGIHDKELKEEFIFISEGLNHKLDAGDVLVVVGTQEAIAHFKESYGL